MDALGSLAQPRQQETTGPTSRPVPAETAAHMPVQVLERWHTGSRVWQDQDRAKTRRRRTIVFAATLALTAAADCEMYQVLNVSRMTVLQVALLVVFTVNFVWIALPCVNGLIGFLRLWRGLGVSGITFPALPQGVPLTTRTALLMPIYNETPQRVFARLQTIYESLDALGVLDHFAIFILIHTAGKFASFLRSRYL